MTALGHVPGPVGAMPPAEDAPRRGLSGYLLMVPGTLWLALFFVVPTVTLVASSLYDPSGSFAEGYRMTWHWQNYTDAWSEYASTFLRSFLYAEIGRASC